MFTYRLLTTVLIYIAVADAFDNKKMAGLPKKMHAVGFYKYLPISDINSLIDLEVNLPSYTKTDVLIEVKAIAMNPLDADIRGHKRIAKTSPRILGWDGSGIVVAKGEDVNLFNVGDEVFFIGDLRRNGSNAQYLAIGQFLVGPKPKKLSFEQAAAMPFTSATTFEAIFDRLMLSESDEGKSLLVINSAGGLGLVATQVGKILGLKVIGTTFPPETEAVIRKFGADVVLNHNKNLIPQLKDAGYKEVDFILVNADPAKYWDTLMAVVKPQGRICLIVDSSTPLNVNPLKYKSLTLSSEMLFTRIEFNMEGTIRYHEILREVSKLFDEGKLKTIPTKTLSPINAANLKKAHRIMELRSMVEKLVLTGF